MLAFAGPHAESHSSGLNQCALIVQEKNPLVYKFKVRLARCETMTTCDAACDLRPDGIW